MDGGLIFGLVMLLVAVVLLMSAGEFLEEAGVEKSGAVALCLVLGIIFLAVGALSVTSFFGHGKISMDNESGEPDITMGVPYEHIGSVQFEGKFVAIIKKFGDKKPLAYYFSEKLPDGMFVKIEEGKKIKYVPFTVTEQAQ